MVSPANNINNPSQEKKIINLELWQACAGPLVNLPVAGTHVVYFPQGHSEQVAASMKKDVDAQIPNYPNLPSKLLCLLHSVTLHADPETDEVFAQMTLQPVPNFDKEGLLRSDLSLKSNKPQTEFFCKTLTASDTSTHGGFSVPRRAAEKIFPPLDFTMQPPAQELVARDLHDNVWTFRHIFRGQPKRHLLTTGWSLFVSGKRLFAGDSVLFIRDEKQHLLLGIRRANRQPPNLSSSVLSSDSMHIGILAAAANAAANNSIFTVFYNPRTSPSEFVIPLAKYYKAVNSYQISLGMRFRMMFETEESGTRRYMGTITGINDLDAVRWKNSQWRNLQVGWDESTAGERRSRVSIWEIEPVTAPFFICPPPFFRSKRPRQPGMPDNECSDLDSLFKRTMPWLGDDMCMKDPQALPGFSLAQWMNMQQAPSLANSIQPSFMQTIPGPVMQNFTGADISRQLGLSASQISQHTNLHFSGQKQSQQVQQIDQPSRIPPTMNPLSSMFQQQLADTPLQPRQILINQTMPSTQVQSQILQPQISQEPNILQQQSSVQSHQFPRILPPVIHQQQQHQHLAPPQIISQNQQQNLISPQAPNQVNQQLQMPENQIQYQLLQNLQPQRQTILAQQSTLQNPAQAILLHDQQQMQGDTSQSFSRPLIPNTMVETQQPTTTSLPQSLNAPQQSTKNNSQMNGQFSTLLEQSNIPPRQSPGMAHELNGNIGLPPHLIINHNQPSTAGSSALTGAAGGHSAITEDVPSCSTSPSTNNCPNSVQIKVNNRTHRSTTTGEEMAQSASLLLSPRALGTMSSSINLVKDIQPKSGIKPSLNISKDQNSGFFSQQPYLNVPAAQTDYLETSSSATSVSFSQNDAHLQHNSHPSSFIPHSMLFRDLSQDGEVLGGPRSNISFGTHIDDQLGMPLNHESVLTKGGVGLGKDFSNGVPSGEMLPKYEYSKEHQQELSSSIISQSFGVPDITFNSIDSALNDSSFLNRGPLAPPTQQFQRIRTYTKVYKRGAVGRSIDITRYSGYDELKQDLARRFGIEGQLEDRHRIGWKLVYVDHENDVLLLGDDPWEEFVNCVRCIKILSPQEVQQMSLDGDIGSSLLPNQACSSSDGGNI